MVIDNLDGVRVLAIPAKGQSDSPQRHKDTQNKPRASPGADESPGCLVRVGCRPKAEIDRKIGAKNFRHGRLGILRIMRGISRISLFTIHLIALRRNLSQHLLIFYDSRHAPPPGFRADAQQSPRRILAGDPRLRRTLRARLADRLRATCS